jgi:DNA-binding response OmpR family regulator
MDLFEPDLAIIDVMMPRVTGYQIIEFMKKNQKFQNVMTIFLSAKDSARDIKYGYKLGANVYITKPFQPERLLKNVQMLLAQAMPSGPRKKTLSMRDISLRMQLKVGLHLANQPTPGEDEETETPDPGTHQHRLKRPLAQKPTERDSKKWVD